MHQLVLNSRVEHPQKGTAADARLQRLIVEFMLRQGLAKSARALSDICEIGDLLDMNVFVQSKSITDSLMSHTTTECLSWCNDHKTVLRKNKNKLEFELRRQEFIELIRSKRTQDAITYAQRNLTAHRTTYKSEVNQTCALLCYDSNTTVEPYKVCSSISKLISSPSTLPRGGPCWQIYSFQRTKKYITSQQFHLSKLPYLLVCRL